MLRMTVLVLVGLVFTGVAVADCVDWSTEPWSRTTFSSMNSWYDLHVGTALTLGVGSVDTPYSRIPYLVAFANPGGFPDGPPVELEYLDRLLISDFAENIGLNGDYAYLPTGRSDLTIVDVSDPTRMSVSHTMPLANGCRDMIVVEDQDLLITAEWDAVRFYSTAQPDSPQLLSTEPAAQAMALARDGDYLYVACASLGLRVLDISNPSYPNQIAHLPVGGSVRDVAVDQNLAVLVGPAVGLVTVDLTYPGAPSRLFTVACEGEPEEVLVANGFAYIRTQNARFENTSLFEQKLLLFELPGAMEPVLIGSYFPRMEGDVVNGTMTIAGDNLLLGINTIRMANLQCGPVSAVNDRPQLKLTLGAPWPNPFNPTVDLIVGLPLGHGGRLTVYDMRGQKVKDLWAGQGSGQDQIVRWHGHDQQGGAAPSGSYLFVLRNELVGHQTTVKASLVR